MISLIETNYDRKILKYTFKKLYLIKHYCNVFDLRLKYKTNNHKNKTTLKYKFLVNIKGTL